MTSVFDHPRRGIMVDGEFRRLTPQQWLILTALRRKAERISSYDLLDIMYSGVAEGGTVAILRVQINRLRKALEGSGYRITSRWGKGYLLVGGNDGAVSSWPLVRPTAPLLATDLVEGQGE